MASCNVICGADEKKVWCAFPRSCPCTKLMGGKGGGKVARALSKMLLNISPTYNPTSAEDMVRLCELFNNS